jgi:hypothetical protein
MENFNVIYEYGESPLKKANKLVVGELYATSNGDIVLYDGEEFKTAIESPLTPIQGNTVENLTELQLSLYWTLIKNNKKYDGDN